MLSTHHKVLLTSCLTLSGYPLSGKVMNLPENSLMHVHHLPANLPLARFISVWFLRWNVKYKTRTGF